MAPSTRTLQRSLRAQKTLDVHIVPSSGRRRWRVTHAGLTISSHHTQDRAHRTGVRLARINQVDLVIHGTNGRIRSKDSYGNETAAPDREH